MLFVGVYDPGQVRVTTGEVAYGLFRTGQTWELASVRLTVDSTLYPCRADERAAEAHPRLAIDHPGTPILLLRGVAGLVSGPVLTLVPGDLKPYPGQTLGPYIIGHALWELIGSGASEYRPTRLRPSDANRPAVLGYRLALWSRERDTSQVVYGPYSIFWPPAVAWVGDLDRDGLVDLVLTPSVGQEEPVAPELWLSSLATAGELVHRVTGRRTIYCD